MEVYRKEVGFEGVEMEEIDHPVVEKTEMDRGKVVEMQDSQDVWIGSIQIHSHDDYGNWYSREVDNQTFECVHSNRFDDQVDVLHCHIHFHHNIHQENQANHSHAHHRNRRVFRDDSQMPNLCSFPPVET